MADRDTVHILLVEDDEIDAEAVERSLRRCKVANPLHRVTNGLEALARLRGIDGVERLPRPFVVLLDLNMPKMSGIEFLEEIRNDEALRNSIVFVLTTSDADRDRVAAHERSIAGYVVKSEVGEAFVELVTMLDHHWRVVESPPERDDPEQF